ncbi:glycoside hydrolase family protein [Mariniflexile maritimum]|uniref:sugar-binding protein n=1 Tax=Mariniflexile maritimum TaxID=2682493 RepID=UPI0012F62B04|nr:sugar-binding protein [Mariniflexile maritimum]
MIKYLYGILIFALTFSCSNDGATDKQTSLDPPKQEIPIKTITKPEFVFGFVGQNRYSYAPSSLEQEDGSVHMFFCGNPQNDVMVDNIFHVKINPDGSKTKAKSVVQPGISESWDDHHICDPSVIEGSYLWNNTSFKYVMFYLTNAYGVYYNEIGVAFSNDLEADSWIKYPDQIVRKTWDHDGDQLIAGGWKSWGVGQPSVVSLDGKGKLLLTYTVGDIGGTRIVWSEVDFSNMEDYTISPPSTIVQTGLMAIDNKSRDYTSNSEFAINIEEDKILMIRPVQPMPDDYPSYLNSSLEIDFMNLSDFINNSSSWTPIYRISPDDTGFPRNHNATLLRDNFGYIKNWEKPTFYYTVSKAAPNVQPSASNHAEWTYHIWRAQINENQ